MNNTNFEIVLINVYYPESGYGEKLYYPPLGIAYISEYLNSKKKHHTIIDMGIGYTQNQVIDKLTHIKPKWIGISLNSLLLNKTIDLIKEIREILPHTYIVVGGPHITTQAEKVFTELKDIDYAITGEGEYSFFKLINNEPLTDIGGLIYKDVKGNLISNEKKIITDLDNLPFPKLENFELNKYGKRIIPILTSRGCPFKCIFCQQSSLLSKNWRGISAKYFIEKIKYWKEQGYKEIHILDDNFTFNHKRLERIIELYENENIKDVKFELIGGIRISQTTKKTLSLLKRLNIELISFGVESFSDKVLQFIKKNTTKKQIEETIKTATEKGFKVRLFFIIGFPHQTIKSIRNAYKLILTYPIYQVRFFNLVPYEKTLLMDWLDKNGEMLYPPSVYMNDFKNYQDIPLFKANNTMSIEARTLELKYARDVARIVNERSKYLFDELDNKH